jgi:hypothetical protein
MSLPEPTRPRSLVTSLSKVVGSAVRVCGWAEPDGDGLVLRDHTGRVRLEASGAATPEAVVAESAIEAEGQVVDGGDGAIAIAVDELRVVGAAHGPLPISETSPLE